MLRDGDLASCPVTLRSYDIGTAQYNQNLPELAAAAEAKRGGGFLARFAHGVLCLAGAAGLFVTYEHLKATGQSGVALACLAGAALLALWPVRLLLGGLFTLERKALHLAHGVAGLALVALPLSGLISGTPVLTHAAMAPFALMGAAQAITHQDHPRNARQAEALRRFAGSLPEVAQFAKPGDFSAANAARASRVLGDLLSKAKALGETELDADPGFQSALKNATLRTGLDLSLDAVDRSLDAMAKNPAAASAVPALRARLAEVRSLVAKHAH